MTKHDNNLRQQLRTAIDGAMTATLSVGEAVSVGVMAAEVFATAVRPQEKDRPGNIHVVSWPTPEPGQPLMRRALGFYDKADAIKKASLHSGAEVMKLELV